MCLHRHFVGAKIDNMRDIISKLCSSLRASDNDSLMNQDVSMNIAPVAFEVIQKENDSSHGCFFIAV